MLRVAFVGIRRATTVDGGPSCAGGGDPSAGELAAARSEGSPRDGGPSSVWREDPDAGDARRGPERGPGYACRSRSRAPAWAMTFSFS